MQIICVSRGTLSGGRQLAEKLADKLGYQCLSREDLIEAAVEEGIQVGKLETAMIKPGIFNERLAREREHYIAFTTAYLCERARQAPLVYHGRTGHLLLPRVAHVLRVRVVADEEYRVNAAMQQLGVDRDKARRYLEDVDEDRKRWVHNLYGVFWEDSAQYDIVINLAQMHVENAATALLSLVQLPDFQITPASRQAIEDLDLGARGRLALARHELTFRTSFKVRADKGVVTVTYNPRDSQVAPAISTALEGIEGIKEVRATMATTNILWIQEKFNPQSEGFGQLVEIATKWNAAVELLCFDAGNGDQAKVEEAGEMETTSPGAGAVPARAEHHAANGGIEDDQEESESCAVGGMTEALEELAKLGRSGGGRSVKGGLERLLRSLDRNVPYTLVVIGDVFLDRGHAARLRLSRELSSFMSDHLRAPVVTMAELKDQFLFTKRDLFQALGLLVLTAAIYVLVFSFQLPVLKFLTATGWQARAMACGALFILVPLVAYSYGTMAKAFFKLIKME